MDEPEAAARRIAEAPHAWPSRDEIRPGLRAMAYKRYLIFYSIAETSVRIERVLQGNRDIGGEFE